MLQVQESYWCLCVPLLQEWYWCMCTSGCRTVLVYVHFWLKNATGVCTSGSGTLLVQKCTSGTGMLLMCMCVHTFGKATTGVCVYTSGTSTIGVCRYVPELQENYWCFYTYGTSELQVCVCVCTYITRKLLVLSVCMPLVKENYWHLST